MSGRPWLEALKATMRERSAGTIEPPEENPQALSQGGCKRCESLIAEPPLVVDTPTRITSVIQGEDEERLIAAGWKPKERGGIVIWANPESGFYFSQEVTLHLLKRRVAL